jgi:hypothetical protein
MVTAVEEEVNGRLKLAVLVEGDRDAGFRDWRLCLPAILNLYTVDPSRFTFSCT